jgi:hypothetical protein
VDRTQIISAASCGLLLTGAVWQHLGMSERPDESAHDVLAAEEFGVPAPDPVLHAEAEAEPPHDVLAAEEFEVGSGDPALHHGPLRLPDDPSGSAEPHDVLAAEEFAVPAAQAGAGESEEKVVTVGPRALAATLGVGALVAMLVRRRRR